MTAVVITAAGSSTRMGGSVKKEYLPLGCGTVLSQSVKTFLAALAPAVMVITVPVNGEQEARDALSADRELAPLLAQTSLRFVEGGATRQLSVYHALESLEKDNPTFVLVHDGARPFVTEQIIKETARAAEQFGAAAPAIPPVDTQKECNEQQFITRHLHRDSLASIQTPQAFRFPELLSAHRKAARDGITYTDDTEIWGTYAGQVKIVPGDVCNKKITYQFDLPAKKQAALFRTGLGYDIHPLVAGRALLLGGVHIAFDKGEDGHSDGDVLLHAVTDALLGASHLGDIGSFFPPDDDTWKDADSADLLSLVWKKIKAAGWELGNLDCVVKLEQPKFLPYRTEVCTSIARILGVSADCVFVKAKTGEKMGPVGCGDAVEAWCSCLLCRPASD